MGSITSAGNPVRQRGHWLAAPILLGWGATPLTARASSGARTLSTISPVTSQVPTKNCCGMWLNEPKEEAAAQRREVSKVEDVPTTNQIRTGIQPNSSNQESHVEETAQEAVEKVGVLSDPC